MKRRKNSGRGRNRTCHCSITDNGFEDRGDHQISSASLESICLYSRKRQDFELESFFGRPHADFPWLEIPPSRFQLIQPLLNGLSDNFYPLNPVCSSSNYRCSMPGIFEFFEDFIAELIRYSNKQSSGSLGVK